MTNHQLPTANHQPPTVLVGRIRSQLKMPTNQSGSSVRFGEQVSACRVKVYFGKHKTMLFKCLAHFLVVRNGLELCAEPFGLVVDTLKQLCCLFILTHCGAVKDVVVYDARSVSDKNQVKVCKLVAPRQPKQAAFGDK